MKNHADPPLTTDLDTRTHRALAAASRVRILEVLRASPHGLDAIETAAQVGLHHNTVRSHLALLLEARLVTKRAEERSQPGRPRAIFEAAGEERSLDGSGYRLLAQILASHLVGSTGDPAAAAEDLGRSWGSYLIERPAPFERVSRQEAMERILSLFAGLGFQPELEPDEVGDRMLLHRCPYREVAEERPEIACSLHLGLMRGALAELDAPLATTELLPFVEPTLCVARLT